MSATICWAGFGIIYLIGVIIFAGSMVSGRINCKGGNLLAPLIFPIGYLGFLLTVHIPFEMSFTSSLVIIDSLIHENLILTLALVMVFMGFQGVLAYQSFENKENGEFFSLGMKFSSALFALLSTLSFITIPSEYNIGSEPVNMVTIIIRLASPVVAGNLIASVIPEIIYKLKHTPNTKNPTEQDETQ